MKVIGMGDNVIDRYINRKRMFPGGNAVNFAVYASMCQIESAYLGNIAADTEGFLIWNALSSLGVDLAMSRMMEGYRTERCDVILENGDRTFQESLEPEDTFAPPPDLDAGELEYLRSFDFIHCGCYARMEHKMRNLKEFSSLRSFDFSEEPEFREAAYLDMVCPYIDIALFSGSLLDEAGERDLVTRVSQYGVSFVLVTHGTRGQNLYTRDGRMYRGNVKIVDSAVDTMGAGDSFFAGFVSTLLKKGWNKEYQPTPEMIDDAFSFASEFSAGICSEEGAFGFGTDYE